MNEKEQRLSVGERIREARKDKGLTQEGLLEKMEEKAISPSTLSLVENGRRQPRSATIKKIADALGVRFEDLLPKEQGPADPSSPSLQDIRELLLRYEPLRGMDLAVDRICEQIQLWSVFRGQDHPY